MKINFSIQISPTDHYLIAAILEPDSQPSLPSWLGLENTLTTPLQRGKTPPKKKNVLDMYKYEFSFHIKKVWIF